MERSRKISIDEKRLLDFLINKASLNLPNNWEKELLVSSMQDEGMGSLFLTSASNSKKERIFGMQISECCFIDKDGIEVIASLNVDQNGDLFELDIWKTDYSPLISIPTKFN